MMDVIYMGNTPAGRQDPEPARCLPRQAHVSRRTHQAKINLSRKLELGPTSQLSPRPPRDASSVLVDSERALRTWSLNHRADRMTGFRHVELVAAGQWPRLTLAREAATAPTGSPPGGDETHARRENEPGVVVNDLGICPDAKPEQTTGYSYRLPPGPTAIFTLGSGGGEHMGLRNARGPSHTIIVLDRSPGAL